MLEQYNYSEEESGRTMTLLKAIEQIEKLECELEQTRTDLKNVIIVLLTVSPEHRDWVEKNWNGILEELEK